MPHWGKAWALGPNYNLDIDEARANAANDAVAKAQSLAANGAEHEKAYIDALAVRYSADPKADRAALARAFSQRDGRIVEAVSRRSRCGRDLRGKPDEPDALEIMDA